MHRKPKKPKNPLFPKDHDSTENSKAELPEFSDKEKMENFIDNNKGSIITFVILCFVSIVIYQGSKIYKQKINFETLSAYNTAYEENNLLSFSENHGNTLIGGLSLMQIANEAYNKNKYEDALKYYLLASDSFYNNESYLYSKSLLGVAFSKYNIKSNDWLEEFESILKNNSLLDIVRAEAAFVLYANARVNGDLDRVNLYSNLVSNLENKSIWESIINQFPEDLNSNQ